ncbi:hypothetical protein SFA35_25565 (plasmid) [Pseudomonas sp. HR96]|uniref:hypothetical protein n=1 Tax=Pseudomonas sp. HR96 TaxID=1027966 RepID=UPI002A764375|nr:hypothetical protein [Pseudomonas sp. HR96]WPP02364.1 hypothetical protein SFA35_25565 [Pseudomonas sp. HR96]
MELTMAHRRLIPSPFDSSTGLPSGLPDAVYASWVASVLALRDSPSFAASEQHYQFCIGYVQALQDAQVIDPRLCRFMLLQLQHIWLHMRTTSGNRRQ